VNTVWLRITVAGFTTQRFVRIIRKVLMLQILKNKNFFYKILENIMIIKKLILSISLVMLFLPVKAGLTSFCM
jgi:hypothetical protein